MNTVSEETVEDGGYPIRKSVSSAGSGSTVSGGKTRRNSIGVTSSRKSVGVEGNAVPNYLRASTGSCHDFCKFGKHTEHTKSAIPIKFKRSTVVNKEKVMKTVVAVEIKKTAPVKKIETPTYPKIRIAAEPVEVTKRVVVSVPSKKAQISKPVLSTNGKATENVVKTFKRSTSCAQPSRVTVNHGASAGSNGMIKKKDDTAVRKMEMTPKSAPVKKVPSESHPAKASFRRATSLKETTYRSVKQVTPLKDQNRLQKTKPKKSSSDKVQTNNFHDVEASEVKPETMEFDFIHQTMELVSDSVCNSSESFSGKDIVEEESTVIHPVYESSELFLDKHLLEESLIDESSELLQEPLMELVNDPVCNSSESFSGENVLKQKSTIILPVYDSSELFSNKELLEEALIAESSELFEEKEFLEEESLIAHPVVESSQSNSEKYFCEEETLIAPPVVESRQSNSEKEFLEEELLINPVVESSQSNSEKEFVQESLIVPSLSESSESFYDEDVVLEDESDYTDDEEEVESENTDNLKVCATTIGDEMETTKKISRKGRMVISEDKDDEAVKLRFRRGKILDPQAEKNNSPRRLKFRRGKVVEGKDVKQHISKRTFEKKSVEEIDDSNPARESVVLKHQGEQEKKDAQGLFNNVIEETATKLAETKKSKVKALVGAFETVISLQDGKP